MVGLYDPVGNAVIVKRYAGLVDQRNAIRHEHRALMLLVARFDQVGSANRLARAGRGREDLILDARTNVLAQSLYVLLLVLAQNDLFAHFVSSTRSMSVGTILPLPSTPRVSRI